MSWTCEHCGRHLSGDVILPVYCPCRKAWPRWAVLVRYWYRRPGDRGLGDSFEHMAEQAGAKRVAEFLKRYGIDCGCGDRKQWMNASWPYTSAKAATDPSPTK